MCSQVQSSQKGFTLVELIVVLALLVIALGAIYQCFFFGYQSYANAEAESKVQEQAQTTLQQMDNEVRNAIIATNENKAVSVSADQRTLTIYSNVTGDNKPEKITYQLQNYPSGSTTYRLLKCVQQASTSNFPYSYPALPTVPTNTAPDNNLNPLNSWMTVVRRIDNDKIFSTQPDAIFKPNQYSMNDIIIQVDMMVNNRDNPLPQPVEVKAVLTVRNQGVKAS